MIVTIYGCSACGEKHEDIYFDYNKIDDVNFPYSAECPNTKKKVRMKVIMIPKHEAEENDTAT